MTERKKYRMLNRSDCIPNEKDYIGKLLILKSDSLKEAFKQPYLQYFIADGGFGCNPDNLNGKIFGRFLADGVEAVLKRNDFYGVADESKLPNWATDRFHLLTAPKMRIRIFQINDNIAKKHIGYLNYNSVMKKKCLDSAVYQQVYGGVVNCANIEDVSNLWNTSYPPGYYGRSLAVSDIVEVCNGENESFYYCDTIGFKQIEFDTSKADCNMLKVLIIENGKEPYMAEIRDELKAKQSVVGGLIEPVYFTANDNALIYCDEEFLLKNYNPNRAVGNLIIHGTFMIIGNGVNDENEEIEVSLTDEQIEKYSDMFSPPLIYLTNKEATELELNESEDCPKQDSMCEMT